MTPPAAALCPVSVLEQDIASDFFPASPDQAGMKPEEVSCNCNCNCNCNSYKAGMKPEEVSAADSHMHRFTDSQIHIFFPASPDQA